jgi:hypothetical protein
MKKDKNAIMNLLLTNLQEFSREKLDSCTCLKIYVKIFETLQEVVTMSKLNISNEALNYVAQLYYDSIVINGNQQLDQNVFDRRASVKNIETKDLVKLIPLVNDIDLLVEVLKEIKHRS